MQCRYLSRGHGKKRRARWQPCNLDRRSAQSPRYPLVNACPLHVFNVINNNAVELLHVNMVGIDSGRQQHYRIAFSLLGMKDDVDVEEAHHSDMCGITGGW